MKKTAILIVVAVLALGTYSLFAQNADSRMSFFLTSAGPGDGADLGGLAGGLVAGGLYLSLADDSSDGATALWVTSAGITGGLTLAYSLTRNMKTDRIDRKQLSWIPTVIPSTKGRGGIMSFAGQFE